MNRAHKPLSVLLVEDSQDDADLILLELNEGGFDTTSARVETEAAMRAAMANHPFDVVISDFNLPGFSAHGALAVLRETGRDIPFIVVSGCIGEERAVALMKQGASDFVMKDKLVRLTPVIERELREVDMRREHRQTQQALQEKEKMLNGITASIGEGILVLNDGGRLLFMNPAAERLLGWTESELFYREVYPIIHTQQPDGARLPEPGLMALGVLREGEVHRAEDDIFWSKDGTPIPVSIVASAIMENGKAIASVIAFQDISRRKQTEWNLLESRKQLRELSSHLQTVREEERTRIARELHDELGQMLMGVKLDAKWLANRLSGAQPEVTGKVDAMSRLIDETLDAMRRVAADLRPTMLDDLGLAAAVEWLTEDFAERTGIHIQLDMDMEEGQCDCPQAECGLDAKVATAAFRIVQECLTNVARHAQAGHVLVSLDCYKGKLMLLLSDNGKGIPADHKNKRNSYGMIGMRERAHDLGGTFDVFSIPGDGVAVVAVLPVQPVERTGAAQ